MAVHHTHGLDTARAESRWTLKPSLEKRRNPMKQYTMSFAASLEHRPEHPERTAKRSLAWDVQFQVWPNRRAMLKTIELQGRRATHHSDWKACKWICSTCRKEHMLSGVLILNCPTV